MAVQALLPHGHSFLGVSSGIALVAYLPKPLQNPHAVAAVELAAQTSATLTPRGAGGVGIAKRAKTFHYLKSSGSPNLGG